MSRPDGEVLNDLTGALLDIIAACRPTAAESLNGMVHDDINTDLLMQKLVIYICDRDAKIVSHARSVAGAQR